MDAPCLFLQRLGVSDLDRAAGPSMRDIAERVAKRHGLSLEDLKSQSRAAKFIPARHEAMALCYGLGKSNIQVAHFFRRVNHSTTVHARRRYAASLAEAA